MKLGMSISAGFRTALATRASWIENMVDTNKTHLSLLIGGVFRVFTKFACQTILLTARGCSKLKSIYEKLFDGFSPMGSIVVKGLK